MHKGSGFLDFSSKPPKVEVQVEVRPFLHNGSGFLDFRESNFSETLSPGRILEILEVLEFLRILRFLRFLELTVPNIKVLELFQNLNI